MDFLGLSVVDLVLLAGAGLLLGGAVALFSTRV